jgi:manganese efflux pump family protein
LVSPGETDVDWLTLLALALALAMDCLAVSIAAGLANPHFTPRPILRLAFHFGLFQCLMPIAGWLLARSLHAQVSAYDHWVAFILLAFIGGKMLWEAGESRPTEQRDDPSRGWRMVTLSVATSIDALAVGLSLSLLRVSVWTPSLVIGVVAAVVSVAGLHFGSRLGRHFGRYADALGGLVLLAVGLKVLLAC